MLIIPAGQIYVMTDMAARSMYRRWCDFMDSETYPHLAAST